MRDLPASVLLPGLVNAHTHLDLSSIGPLEHDPHDPETPFEHWLTRVREQRPQTDEQIAEAVRAGIDLCLRGGVVAVGDIAGAPAGKPSSVPMRALVSSPLAGVCYHEFFAMGRARDRGIDAIRAVVRDLVALELLDAPGDGVRAGLQPHAPYSVEPDGYAAAIGLASAHRLPLATHLAETLDERRFVARAIGPRRDFLEQLGLWEPRLDSVLGRGLHPASHLAQVLAAAADAGHPFLCAHLADLDAPGAGRDRILEILCAARVHPVYCPRSSAYFATERELGPHPYRDMLAAGLPVALGTDSILNLTRRPELGPIDGGSHGLSVLDEARLLHRRDGTDPMTLLSMMTTHGAAALGLDASRVGLEAGDRPLGVLAVLVGDLRGVGPMAAVLGADAPPEFV